MEEGGITDPPAMYQKRNAVMCPVLFKGKKNITKEESGKILLSFFFKQRRCAITENLL